MLHRTLSLTLLALLASGILPAAAADQPGLEAGWDHPPASARLRAYWWWLNGNVDKAAITRDLEQMRAQGFGGALICDAGGAEQRGNDQVPAGPVFASDAWRELYRHALREADRLGLEMSLNILSGWNIGGPSVPAADAVKKITWSEAIIEEAGPAAPTLAQPAANDGLYHDLYVLAFPLREMAPDHAPLQLWQVKALHQPLRFTGPNAWYRTNSAPDTAALLEETPATPGEEDTRAAAVLDLSDRLGPDGVLDWTPPPGRWRVLRFGWTLADKRKVSTHSEGWAGYALDVLDTDAFRRYWDAVVEPLIADAGALAGTTLRHLHTDSWEIGVFNWTPALRAEFRRRRGYDPLPYFPVLAGCIVDSRDSSNRFLHDYRQTLGDLVADHHYKPFSAWAARHGLGIHPESGGPHFTPIDSLRCLGLSDVPMSEFWADSPTHRTVDEVRFFVKQPASAAHVYGRRQVAAEGFTTVGPHWQETLWDNLKPVFDHACGEGLNLLFWHAFVCSPETMGTPGQQYFAGTHLNPLVTWWSRSAPFFAYINRCQWLLQQGHFVADVAFYYGDHVPNYTQLRASDPAGIGAGYDYDVITADAILNRLETRDGWLVLPDGMRYRMLVLPPQAAIALPVLRKVRELVAAGATVVGPRPQRATGLHAWPAADAEVARIAAALWEHADGPGKVIGDRSALEVLQAAGIGPDFACSGAAGPDSAIRAIHRRTEDADIYFVASRGARPERIEASFRVTGRVPELWDPLSGRRWLATDYTAGASHTLVPLAFAPHGSIFVVFREPAAAHPATGQPNFPRFAEAGELRGPWSVSFQLDWTGPQAVAAYMDWDADAKVLAERPMSAGAAPNAIQRVAYVTLAVEFAELACWTTRPEEVIRHYSGTATYRREFELPEELAGADLHIDLGELRELAEVRLNGEPLGIVWAPPFRVAAGKAARAGGNVLEVDIVNFWPNRLIGDAGKPPAERLTRTNIRAFKPDSPLLPSGLFGPVRLLIAE